MENDEQKLIGDLVLRITGMVVAWSKIKEGEQTQEEAKQEELRNQNVDALLQLSATKLNVVAASLCAQFNKLQEKFTESEEDQASLAKARVFMLDLMGNCLAFSWAFLKKRFKDVEGSDEKEKIMLKQKEELILPPPLEDPLAMKILDICYRFLLTSTPPPHLPQELKDKAGKLLFQLSASNFEEPVFSRISTNINVQDEAVTPINLLEYLNLNSNRLSNLLVTITKAVDAGVFKKDNIRLLLARVLTKAIWNWIDHYPMEFVSLCQSSTRLGGEPDKLFDVFVGWSGKNKKGYYWEVQTMLLVLCPDIMLKVALHKDSKSKETADKEKFMSTLNKALSGKLADVSAVCFVDICKASTFVSKTDMSALRYIVPAIETELKERLFNPQAPFKTSGGNEVELMTDCLIASFRLSPRKVVNSLFTDFLKPNFPPIFKLVLVNTLQRIVDEGASLPWNPTIADVYSGMAHQLRALFQDYEQQARNYNELVKQSDKKSKTQLEKLLKDIEILTCLIVLFHSDPNLPLHSSSKSAAADLEDTRNLLTGLCSMASLFSQPELSAAASKTLLTLHRPDNIARWCTQNVLSGFWDISSAVNICIANVLTDRKDLRISDILHFISLLKQILLHRNAFLSTIHKGGQEDSKPVEVGDTNSRALASTQLEVALLIHVCSSEIEIVTKVENCFGLLCDEIDIVGASETENSLVTNYSIYRKLAATSALVTGRAAQQREIRLEIRRIRQTKGNYTAWDQVHQRWTVLTQGILKAYEEDLKKRAPKGGKPPPSTTPVVPPEKMVEWNHFSGFLAAAAGVTMGEEMVKVEQTRKDKTETTIKVTDGFISELLKLIISDHDVIRETTTELAGSTLSPAVYSVLFHHLHKKVNKFFGKEGQIKYKPRATTFVDQTISIIKHIMELPGDSHTADDLALLVNFEDLVTHLVKYVSGLVIKENPAMGLRIKLKMCGCLEAIMKKHQFISFNNEFPFRQSLVDILIEWISDFSAKPKYKASPFEGVSEEKKKEAEKFVQDVDVAAVKAISALLRGLSFPKEEGEESETSALKKYFTFFTNLIGRAKSENPELQVSQKADLAVGALSNLLSANIDSALEYFITMGYHEDLETRAAFLKVLSNILRQGTEFDSVSHEGDKYDKLVELLLEPKLEVVLALSGAIQITEADDVAQLLVRLFEANERTMDLLKKSIKQEVSKTETENTLFRRNSMATKLLAAYSKMIGTRTLKEMLTPVLQSLIANPISLELDPAKLPPGQDRTKNIENVTKTASAFLKAITDYLPITPLPFREICHYMKTQVGKRFPGAEHSAIGGFMMLRFICPAIVAPDGFGLVQSIALSVDLRRGLVLTTKVLQNLANKVLFSKEPHMEEMNAFLKEQMPTIEKYFDDLAVIPENGIPVAPLHVPEEQKEEDLANLHYHLSNSLDKLHKVLPSEGKKKKKKGSAVFVRLTAILSQLGPAPEPSRNTQFGPREVSSKKAATNNLHAGFMDEHAKLDTSAIDAKKLFYKHGFTKDKQAVFYFVARRLEKTFTQEQLIIHIMKTLQPELGKPFVVVIDCTLFSKEYEITPAWISRFRQVAPSFDNLMHLFIVNANYEFKKYSKKIARPVSRARSKMIFVSSVKELFNYIPEKDIGIPASTLAVEKDVKASFSPVQKLMQYNNQKEVILRISNNLFAVVTVKQHNIFGKRVPLVDLFHISSIFEINVSVDTTELVIKYDKDAPKSMTFRTPAAEQIILALKASKARWNLSKAEEVSKRSFRASDVPGTLLNMALLNLGNPTVAALRVEAYNLLAALCSSFNLSVQASLWETAGLCIPKNTNNFIVSLSKKLATNESHMTLEFLTEALHGIEKIKANLPGKQLSLNYITHWLANLRIFCIPSDKPEYPSNLEKVKEIVHLLIEFTIRETTMTGLGPAIQSQVWEVVGTVPEILDLVIDCLLERANDKKTGGLTSTALAVIGDVFVSMASQNPQLVSGKVIARLMNVLAQTHGTKERLEDHVKWREIESMVRVLLMLSFENLVYVSQYLPELFHLVLLLFATGPPLARATVHGLLINIVHSLYTSMPSAKSKLLSLLLSELDQQKSRVVFGLGGLSISAFSKPSEKAVSLEAAPMTIGTVETVATTLLSILNYCSPSGSCLGTPWHSRFLSLATRTAYTPNAALQPRALIALGVLCNSPSLVTDNLMSQVLHTLFGVLQSGQKLNQDLPLSLIICLTKLFEHLPPRSKYFKPMFWLAMVLLEIDEAPLFGAAIGLLEAVLKTMDSHDCFADGIISYCMAAREECALEEALCKADQVTGINFKTSFSFAVAGHLLKGLREPATKTATARVLSTFVDIAAKKAIGNSMLGYLAVLLPIKGDDMENMRQLLSGEAGAPHQYLFREDMLPDTMNGALLFTLLVTILKSSAREHEQQFIYESLKEGVLAMPEAFPVVYDVLIPKMTYVIQNSTNTHIIDACLCIMKSIFSADMEATTSKKRLNKDYLATKIGFQGLIDCDTFEKPTSAKTTDVLVKITSQILEQMFKLRT